MQVWQQQKFHECVSQRFSSKRENCVPNGPSYVTVIQNDEKKYKI